MFERISESDNFVVDYDAEKGMYRVSYFEDNHFADETFFDAVDFEEYGQWIKRGENIFNDNGEVYASIWRAQCPKCHGEFLNETNYCPDCGLKMRKNYEGL